jgi:hypothetical protein
MAKQIWVLKESGEKELFSPEKVRRALRRTGLSTKEADSAIKLLREKLYDGITTRKIYALLYGIVDSMRPEVSHKYNLKRALQQIGPAGYNFEDFTARLLSLEGYDTKVRQLLQGKCVTHEIDVVAAKDSKRYMIECKFYNKPGYRCRIQNALYVHARFLDLLEGAKKGLCQKFTKPWLVTNTKFSAEVLEYAQCMDMPLLGWRHPLKYGLEAMIDKRKCYPITVLKIGRDTLGRLLRKNMVTVFDIPESPHKLADITGISLTTAKNIVEHAEYAR